MLVYRSYNKSFRLILARSYTLTTNGLINNNSTDAETIALHKRMVQINQWQSESDFSSCKWFALTNVAAG